MKLMGPMTYLAYSISTELNNHEKVSFTRHSLLWNVVQNMGMESLLSFLSEKKIRIVYLCAISNGNWIRDWPNDFPANLPQHAINLFGTWSFFEHLPLNIAGPYPLNDFIALLFQFRFLVNVHWRSFCEKIAPTFATDPRCIRDSRSIRSLSRLPFPELFYAHKHKQRRNIRLHQNTASSC